MKFTLNRLDTQEVEVDPQSVITFPSGIPPFDDSRRYKLFHEEGKGSVFWLQSLDDADVLFSVTDPDLLKLSYEVSLSDAEQQLLDIAPGDELVLSVIVYKEGEGAAGAMNVNARAPIVINVSKRLGLQKLLQDLETTVSIKGR